ncbi:MAG: helix-hairpin-helix domain-containing protein, partial [Desulfohalobiaceae bacterium]|nr:helix-hairpin-helix domain-containing protein [Desulfohalobiaceae bacterium]
MMDLTTLLIEKTGLRPEHVRNILGLLEGGATVPFIARYRKEMTGAASDAKLRDFEKIYLSAQKLLERKAEVLRIIEERSRLTPEIQTQVESAATLSELEDLYRPFREKKSTRGGQALARGLEALAEALEQGDLGREALQEKARAFLGPEVPSPEAAIQGAKDILAERFADDPKERSILRREAGRHGVLEVKPGREFDPSGVFKQYAQHRERMAAIPSHRYLAIRRGVRQKQLSWKISLNTERFLENIRRQKAGRAKQGTGQLLLQAWTDGLNRLLLPSIEREMHRELKERSDQQAVSVFGANLAQLLMTPPVTGRTILGVDPAYRTGCKLAVIDARGVFQEKATIFPTPPFSDFEGSRRKILELVERFGVDCVAIGNGTGCRETREFFARFNQEQGVSLEYTVVSEAGASVYSASETGQQEYPDLDATVRGAISIAQRLRDPMAELVKIDPKSLGIGQYQHDVDQKLLERKLKETIEDLVNRVGVEVNSASPSLLSYLAGITPGLARAIAAHRREQGLFSAKKDLLRVKGLGPKTFEQCGGFVRIRNGASLLDNTGVHPESYKAAARLLKEHEVQTVTREETRSLAANLGLGLQTLEDILFELKKPGF